ncbi:hypothetical protein DSCOOX_45570 [Desulfosarcina ovata subsp. ovata]|uniref:Uncharacterized protein n=1 Tax=Desulfosarcina ovata subsp. ovata TaxID=2752305 RepID=A0A5K8AFJ5_9BACT|nr:hypothetical protein DSCOOX_45570 [Desulfosarcina ovata subsp. ovata]
MEAICPENATARPHLKALFIHSKQGGLDEIRFDLSADRYQLDAPLGFERFRRTLDLSQPGRKDKFKNSAGQPRLDVLLQYLEFVDNHIQFCIISLSFFNFVISFFYISRLSLKFGNILNPLITD